jgi:hypothetical protein
MAAFLLIGNGSGGNHYLAQYSGIVFVGLPEEQSAAIITQTPGESATTSIGTNLKPTN